MKTTITNRKIRVLLSAIQDLRLIPSPDFPRHLVWTNKDRRNFLKTVLDRYPFPEVYIAAGEADPDTGEGAEMLVDGQQRLTTLYQYFIGSKYLQLGKEIPPYAELPEEKKTDFLEYEVVVRDLGKISMEEIKNVFQRINDTSYSPNAMEIRNERYNGEFKQFGDAVAAHPFFEAHGTFSASEIRSKEDVRFALVYIITIMSTFTHLDKELESYIERHNDEFDEKDDVSREIENVFNFVEDCGFEDSSRAWNKADIFTLLVEAHRAIEIDKLSLDPDSVGARLKRFYDRVNKYASSDEGDKSAAEYYTAARQATNDRGSRITRGEIIADVIRAGEE